MGATLLHGVDFTSAPSRRKPITVADGRPRTEGGGAAWANVLAQQHGADAERRHAEETRAVYEQAMAAMADVAKSRAEAAPVVAGGGAPVVTVASTGGSAALTKTCKKCNATLKADAGFCGACGSSQA